MRRPTLELHPRWVYARAVISIHSWSVIEEGWGNGGDPYAATRRAIIRAAAEIGRPCRDHAHSKASRCPGLIELEFVRWLGYYSGRRKPLIGCEVCSVVMVQNAW